MIDGIKLPSIPDLEKKESLHSSLEDDEQLESLNSQIAMYFAKNSQDTPELISSSSGASISNAKPHLEDWLQGDLPVLTQDMILRDMGSVNAVTTAGTKKNANIQSRLGTINKTTRSLSISQQSSIMSHRTSEPDIPDAVAAPAQDMESYMKK